ncbi:unnamed protein product [Oncorhynchus mykiss]|uniref:Uncharacterized protein n=1 Tax=Oncorhynchus mykiss TaxID=8022 RepID=A0A060ZCM0_ONCMY|nr:unnamed protein product [Oncorhynchus mykiss]
MCVWCTPTLTCVCFLSSDNGPYQQNPPPASSNTLPLPEDRRQSLVPVEFAGLLHGSSPACETPDTPYHLYTTNPKARKHTPSDPHTSPVTTRGNEALALKTPKDPIKDDRPPKPQVVYRTIFHTRVNQNPQSALPSSSPYGWNGEAVVVRGGVSGAGGPREGAPGSGYEDRAFTLGRMRSIPRSVLDLKLSKSLSKSDSNLVAVSPIQVCCCVYIPFSWRNRSPSPGDTASPGGQLERTPSFTAEWEEVREARAVAAVQSDRNVMSRT